MTSSFISSHSSLWPLLGLVGKEPAPTPLASQSNSKTAHVAQSCLSSPSCVADPAPPKKPVDRKKLEEDARIAHMIQLYLDGYFSSYQEEIAADDPLVFELLDPLLRRLMNLEKAIKKILPFLDSEDILSAHRPLPEAVVHVLKNKIDLDHCLQKIKLGDLQRAYEAGDREKIKKGLAAICKDVRRIDKIKVHKIESNPRLANPHEDFAQLQDCFSAFYVYPPSFEEQGEKWVIIDMRKVPAKDRQGALKFFTREQIEKDLGFCSDHVSSSEQKRKPGSVLSYDLDHGKPRKKEGANAKNGMIQLFYEERNKTAHSHDDRNVGGRTRLTTVSTDKEGAQLGLAKGDTYRRIKPFERNQTHWTADRERTAAVDRLQAIWTFRLAAKKILTQGVKAVSSNELLNIYGYIRSIQTADLAKNPNSYLQDPVFNQAVAQIGTIEQRLKAAVSAKKSVEMWSSGISSSSKTDFISGLKAAAEISGMLHNWKKQIDDFLVLIENPVYAKEKSQLSWFIQRFKAVSEGVDLLIGSLDDAGTFAAIDHLRKALAQALPEEKMLIEEQIAKYRPDSEKLISDFLTHLRINFKVLQPLVWELTLAYEEPSVREAFSEQIQKTKSLDISNCANSILPACFQLPNRVDLCLKDLFGHCSGTHLKVEILRTRDAICAALDEIESLRSTEMKNLQLERLKVVLSRFFPNN